MNFTKENRIRAIADSTGLDARTVRAVLDADDEGIADALRAGKRVYLDNICTLHVRTAKATRRFIPSKGETIEIPERRVVKFSVSDTLLDRL